MRNISFASALFLSLLTGNVASAQWSGNGDGAIVTSEMVPVFAAPTGDKTVGLLVKGDGFAAAPDGGRKFRSEAGRIRIEFVRQDGKRRRAQTGWVDEPAVAQRFAFACSCAQACWPFVETGRDVAFNNCFQEAMVRTEAVAAATAPVPPGGTKITVETEFGRRAPETSQSGVPVPSAPLLPPLSDSRPGGNP